MTDRTGQQLGNYRLVALLGTGGYAEVYLGQHIRLELQVAIKVLHTHLTGQEAEHFQQEAQAIAKLAHPTIVRVFDFDVQDGVPFLVMDYVPDGSLRRRYPKGSAVPLPQIVSCVKQVAAALQYAHDHKFVHRDVKPENMLVGRQQEVLLSDFGLVALAHSTGSLSAQAAVGTLPYMAPEQIEGHPRPASDQYALGVVVYEWLCGRRPFDGSVTEMMIKHLTMPPPALQERVPTISPEVEQVVLRALAKDPKHRFASVSAFGTALEQASQLAPSHPVLLPMESPSPPASAPHTYATEVASPSQPAPAMEVAPLTSLPGLHQKPANVMTTPFHKPVVCPVVIDRISDLATLHALIDQAKSGRGQVVLLSGEAGIGKSRLVAETKAYAAARSFLLLQGNCFQADISSPYAPLLDLLRSSAAAQLAAAGASNLAPFARELHQFVPDLVALPPNLVVLASLDPEQEKRRLFTALAQFFTDQVTTQPLLFILEDIHWSDETSLEFLLYLARRCAGGGMEVPQISRPQAVPLQFLLTYRSDEVRPSLRHFLAQLDRQRLAQEIALSRFTRSDVDAMLRAIFALPHSARLELPDPIYTLTEGNPFFIEEILTSLIAAGDLFYTDGRWERKPLGELRIPRSVQDAVQQRTDRLSESARRVLILAAVTGRRFDFALLQQLTHDDESQLLSLMKELMAAQLVVEESAEQFAFRHALTRQAMYAQLLVRERKTLHRTIAETMEHLYSSTLEAHLADLAYHFYEAGLWEKALEYAQWAGERAQRLYASRAAIEQFTQALDAAQHLALAPQPTLYHARGQAYETLGNFEQARHDYEQALESARNIHDGMAEWQSMLDLGFLWAGRDYRQTGVYFRRAIELARALADPKLLAHSLNRLGNWYANVEQPLEALHYHQEALTIFQEVHDQHGVAETLDLLGMANFIGGDLVQSAAYCRQVIELFREMDNRQGLVSSLATLLCCGDIYAAATQVAAATSLTEVRQEGERALKLAREIGQRSGEAFTCGCMAECLGSYGEYGHALELAQDGLHIAEEIEHRQWMTLGHWALGMLYLDLLALPMARRHLEQALALAQEIGSSLWIRYSSAFLASVYIGLNDLAQAESLLTTALDSNAPPQTMAQRFIWYARAQLALAHGKPDRALAIIEQLLASAANVSDGQSIPHLSQLRGEALTMLNQLAEAETALQAAHTGAMTRDLRSLLWRIAIDLGKLYQAQRRDEEAEHAFATAQEQIKELAATIPDQSLREHFQQQAAALMPSTTSLSPRRAARRAFSGLTEREREVASLIAQGKANREIADILVVNYRTVEKHVENILSKLGFASRTQIAVWATEKGLGEKEQSQC